MRIERWKRVFGGMFGGGGGEKRPQLCPACGALVGITAKRCHECGTSLQFSLAAWSKGLAEFFGGHAPVTSAILIVNVMMFGVSLVRSIKGGGGFGLFGGISGVELYKLGENVPWRFGLWEWWRLILATFLHGGLLHIGLNMMVLLDIGPVVEEVYGSARYFFMYIVCGIGGSLLSTTIGSHPSVGASGAILGLVGLMIAITTKRGGANMQAMRSRLISWVVSIFAMGFFIPGIDNYGHAGGLAAGFLLGKIFADRQPEAGRERNRAYAMGWLTGALVVAAFVMMFLRLQDPLPPVFFR